MTAQAGLQAERQTGEKVCVQEADGCAPDPHLGRSGHRDGGGDRQGGRGETLMESLLQNWQDRQSSLFPQGCLSLPSGGLGLWPLV